MATKIARKVLDPDPTESGSEWFQICIRPDP